MENLYLIMQGQKSLINAFIKTEEYEKYLAELSFNREDAAMILYSPNLVSRRENIDMTRFNGFYTFDQSIKLSTDFYYLSISDGNSGYRFNGRLGKYLFPAILLGYEFESSNYQFVSNNYYSPQTFSSHSLFGDFDVYNSKENLTKITIGGKIGLIAHSSFLIRQLYASFLWDVTQKFELQGNLAYGSTFQNIVGYSSFSAYLNAYWNL